MQFIATIVGIMGIIAVILYRMSRAAAATKEIIESARDVGLMARRWGWRKKFAKDPLEFVTDPREAAVAMMAALAQADGALTARERAVIVEHTQKMTGSDAATASEFLAHARWVVRDVRDVNRCFSRLAPILQKACTPEQITDVLAMLEAVANADGEPSTSERSAIIHLRQKLA
jgi:uncharacterized tellurite resistance protein B-like protein